MDEPLTMERGGNTYYYHRDGLGSITEITDERYEYDVYGAVTIFDGSGITLTASAIGNPYLFTARRYDPESGNYYYRARYYSPSLGRFLSQGPLGFDAGDYNLYRYAFNSPTNLTDPSGESVIVVTAVIGGIAIVIKVADYVWTTWDIWQSYRVLRDDCASDVEKLLAGLNIALAVVLEAAEPDELLPTGLPVDDVARKALLRGMREALEEGGPPALVRFLRRELGDDLAEQVLRHVEDADDLLRRGRKSLSDALDDFLNQVKPGRSKHVGEYVGSVTDAEAHFRRMAQPGTIHPHDKVAGGYFAQGPDGLRIGFRPTSRWGGPAIDLDQLFKVGKSPWKKVHFGP
jgi:RHS repeat-associated protein